MKTVHLMRAELTGALTPQIDPRLENALQFLIKDLDTRWGSFAAERDPKRERKRCEKFAKKTLEQLQRNLKTAAIWESRFASLSRDSPKTACCLVMHLMRRNHLTRGEQILLDGQVKADRTFDTREDMHVSTVAPVSLRSKALAIVLCVAAFAFPIWFIFIVSARLDQAGLSGRRTKRAIYFKTMVFFYSVMRTILRWTSFFFFFSGFLVIFGFSSDFFLKKLI